MKKLATLILTSMILLSITIMLTNCKKKTEDPVIPAFSVTATTVMLQGGGDGLQFTSKCTNNNVEMTVVQIVDPQQTPVTTYDFNGANFDKNEVFDLQATDVAYLKQTGTWSFTFLEIESVMAQVSQY